MNISSKFKAYVVDLVERTGSSFGEVAVAGLTTGLASHGDFWLTAGATAGFTVVKGVVAYFVPAVANLKTAGLLSGLIAKVLKNTPVAQVSADQEAAAPITNTSAVNPPASGTSGV